MKPAQQSSPAPCSTGSARDACPRHGRRQYQAHQHGTCLLRAAFNLRAGTRRVRPRAGNVWAEIGPIFKRLEASFSNCTAYKNEVLAAGASGDLAYTVAFEHTTASVNGAPAQPYILRVTTIFRREDGDWKVVHRHGDALASNSAAEIVKRPSPPDRQASPSGR